MEEDELGNNITDLSPDNPIEKKPLVLDENNPDPVTPIDGFETKRQLATSPAPVPVSPGKTKAQQILDQIHSTREAQPVPDAAKEARLQRMGRVNALGRGLNVLGDMFTTAIGGRVNRRAPDTTSGAIYNQYSQLMDQNKSDLDAWKHREFATTMQNLHQDLGQANTEDQRAIAQKNLEMKQRYIEEKDRRAQEWKQREFDQKGQFHSDTQGHLKETERQGRTRIGLEAERLDNEKKNQSITYSEGGKDYSINPKDRIKYENIAAENFDILAKMYPDMVYKEQAQNPFGDLIPGKFIRHNGLKGGLLAIAGHRIANKQLQQSTSNGIMTNLEYIQQANGEYRFGPGENDVARSPFGSNPTTQQANNIDQSVSQQPTNTDSVSQPEPEIPDYEGWIKKQEQERNYKPKNPSVSEVKSHLPSTENHSALWHELRKKEQIGIFNNPNIGKKIRQDVSDTSIKTDQNIGNISPKVNQKYNKKKKETGGWY